MMKRMNGLYILGAALLVILPLTSLAAGKTAKNVIVMVPDGCSQSIQTLARWVKGSELNLDRDLNSGMIKTHMANSVITGSAAAGTAFATGHKTTARFIGVGPRKKDLLTGFTATAPPYTPVGTVLEGAELAGKSTGLVATSRISHATPAAFAAHVQDRGMDNEIMEQMVYNNVDVVFGGGARHLIPTGETYKTSFGETWSGKRTDGENLIQVLAERGYDFIDSRACMEGLTSARVWGLFDDSHMDADIDRDDLHPTQPSLAEMTEKAIELLSKDPDGFFLMVEGSQIDWAGHANDPAWMVTDFLAFDEAVGKALEFAESDGETLVLIFPDHNTGALSLGNSSTDNTYTSVSVEAMIDPLKDAKATSGIILSRFSPSPTVSEVRGLFVEYWGSYWKYMTNAHARAVIDLWKESGANPRDAQRPVCEYIAENLTHVGFTTHGHSGESVPLWSYGPDRPVGLFDNTELAAIAAEALGFDLKKVTSTLYVDASSAGSFTIDTSDSENPVLVVGGYQFPASKDYGVLEDGTKKQLTGITVYAPRIHKFFISSEAVSMF